MVLAVDFILIVFSLLSSDSWPAADAATFHREASGSLEVRALVAPSRAFLVEDRFGKLNCWFRGPGGPGAPFFP